MDKCEIITFADDKQLARAAAERWLEWLAAAGNRNPLLVALSGGRIARTFFTAAATLGKSKQNLFNPVHFFWADERCVPPADSESNYRIAQELLFAPLRIVENQIHRIRGEEPPPVAAAEAAEELRRISAMEDTGGNRLKPGHRTERGFRLKPGHQTTPEVQTKAGLQTQPIIDLIFLGMGEDGHVASLFPGNPPPTPEPIYRPVRASKPPPDRITLGYDTIAAAKEVWVLASGPGKEAALNASLGKDRARGQSSLFLPQDTLAKNAGLTPTPLNDSLAAGSKTPLGKVIASRERTLILSDIRL